MAEIEEKRVAIPNDTIYNILLRLPVRSLGRFRCVSKSWLSISNGQFFLRAYVEHSRAVAPQMLIIQGQLLSHFPSILHLYIVSADPKPRVGFSVGFSGTKPHTGFNVRRLSAIGTLHDCLVRASCDGFICIWSMQSKVHAIVNPLTGCSFNLPKIYPTFDTFNNDLFIYFHHSTSKYRVLSIFGRNREYAAIVTKNTWRRIPNNYPAFFEHPHPVDVNGCLHWLACKQNKSQLRIDRYRIILTFDKETEELSIFSKTPSAELMDYNGNLLDFSGKLGFWVFRYDCIFEIWVLEDCWIKMHSIACAHFDIRPTTFQFDINYLSNAVCSRGEDLLIEMGLITNLHYLIRWNLKSGAYVAHNFNRSFYTVYPTFPYGETLLHPDRSF